MSIVNELQIISDAERAVDIERRETGHIVKGDFEGSVTGFWVELDDDGAGVVDYAGKRYRTSTIGFVSLPKGTAVELSYAKGVYYSKY